MAAGCIGLYELRESRASAQQVMRLPVGTQEDCTDLMQDLSQGFVIVWCL